MISTCTTDLSVWHDVQATALAGNILTIVLLSIVLLVVLATIFASVVDARANARELRDERAAETVRPSDVVNP